MPSWACQDGLVESPMKHREQGEGLKGVALVDGPRDFGAWAVGLRKVPKAPFKRFIKSVCSILSLAVRSDLNARWG